MFEILLRIVAERLVALGECPANPDCSYSSSSGCFASGDALEEKMAQMETELLEETLGLTYRDTENPSPWPCEDIVLVVFVDPDD